MLVPLALLALAVAGGILLSSLVRQERGGVRMRRSAAERTARRDADDSNERP